jgi:hypothetical protein
VPERKPRQVQCVHLPVSCLLSFLLGVLLHAIENTHTRAQITTEKMRPFCCVQTWTSSSPHPAVRHCRLEGSASQEPGRPAHPNIRTLPQLFAFSAFLFSHVKNKKKIAYIYTTQRQCPSFLQAARTRKSSRSRWSLKRRKWRKVCAINYGYCH